MITAGWILEGLQLSYIVLKEERMWEYPSFQSCIIKTFNWIEKNGVKKSCLGIDSELTSVSWSNYEKKVGVKSFNCDKIKKFKTFENDPS